MFKIENTEFPQAGNLIGIVGERNTHKTAIALKLVAAQIESEKIQNSCVLLISPNHSNRAMGSHLLLNDKLVSRLKVMRTSDIEAVEQKIDVGYMRIRDAGFKCKYVIIDDFEEFVADNYVLTTPQDQTEKFAQRTRYVKQELSRLKRQASGIDLTVIIIAHGVEHVSREIKSVLTATQFDAEELVFFTQLQGDDVGLRLVTKGQCLGDFNEVSDILAFRRLNFAI